MNFRLNITPDWSLLNSADDITINGCVTGLGCIESSFLCHTCPCITDYQSPDLPALSVCLQYLTQVEVSVGWNHLVNLADWSSSCREYVIPGAYVEINQRTGIFVWIQHFPQTERRFIVFGSF